MQYICIFVWKYRCFDDFLFHPKSFYFLLKITPAAKLAGVIILDFTVFPDPDLAG